MTITTKQIFAGVAIFVDGQHVTSFTGKYAKVQAQVAKWIATAESNDVRTAQAERAVSDAQQERQRTRKAGKYARYEYRCDVCNAGVSSQADMTPDVFTSEVINEIGQVPVVCERCWPKFEGITVAEAIAKLA